MSAQGISREQLGDGSELVVMPYDEDLVKKAVTTKLEDQTETPSPDTDGSGGRRDDSGPILRFNDVFTDIGSTSLEALGLDGFEIGKAIQTRRDEIFRNEFPLLLPRFTRKCTECEAEYDQNIDQCTECGSDQLRKPDPAQKREAVRLFESVNKEGQSLRDLMKTAEEDHARLGVPVLIVKHDYKVANGDQTVLGRSLFEEGQVLNEEVDEIVKADPKRVVPVTDDNGRVGNWKWACPIHRDEVLAEQPGQCPECGTDLREVYFVEKDYVKGTNIEKVYFENEVITWAHFFPRQHGLDGLSPVHHIWIKQAILHWMDVFAAAFYDPNSDSYPNKFMVVHTTNADAWERNFREAEDEAQENLYANQIFVNEYATDSQSTPELQVIDLMDDELRGQNQEIKKSYKSDIRNQFGVTDVFDSELEDAGGLNNEGLQLEVTDRHIATAQRDLMDGPLDELMKTIGMDDWKIAFVPPQSEDLDDLEQKISIGTDAANAGLDARLENEELEIDDGEFEEDTGGGGGLFASEDTRDWEDAAEKLDEGFEHVVWADETTKAEPFWDSDVPETVIEKIKEAIADGAIFDDIEGLSASEKLKDFFEEKLTDPDGWSLGSITDGLQEQFDISKEKADAVGRTESASILNNAKEKTMQEQGIEDEARFKWQGPQDHRTTDACEWLKDKTEGGVTMERLIELEKEAQEKFFPALDTFRKHVVHPNERHTFVQTFKADYVKGAAGDIEVEIDTVPGKLEVVA